jgi:hypothetical protein
LENHLLQILQDTDEGMEEIVLRQSPSGSSLSLVVGKSLFQVVRLDKNSNFMHEFSISRDSVHGFKHHAFEHLHKRRLILILICSLSFIFISPITSTWTAPWYVADLVFLISLTLLVFSLGNPHIFVFTTKSNSYSVFLFQWRSDKDKTSAALSEIGLAMSKFLVSREFIIPEITYNIGQIGDNIGRVGNTIATDSVVMEETVQSKIPPPPLMISTNESEQEE